MKTEIILSPYDSGHRGKRMGAGPAAVVQAGLVDRVRAVGHEAALSEIGVDETFPTEIGTGFSLCRALAGQVADAVAGDRFPVVLAGNCLTSLGTASGAGCDAVIWFDQHGDLNTPETSASGFLDGMGLSILLGRCWRSLAGKVVGYRPIAVDRAVLVDGRDLDPDEASFITESRLTHVAIADAAAAAQRLAAAGARRVYMHVDLDVHDPALLRANSYATPGGPSPEALRDAVVAVIGQAPVAAVAVTAYDPAFDPAGRVAVAVVELIEAVLSARAEQC